MVETLSIYTLNDNGSKSAFPNEENQAKVRAYTYTVGRMGALSLNATLMYPECLDDKWTERQFVDFLGERYFVFNTPTSSKSNTDARWKHDLVFQSERVKLSNTYFYDAVSPDAGQVDQYVSNSTSFTFYGDIAEFVKRLNYSLQYSGLEYSVVIDEGISSESKLMSFEDKFFEEVLQEIFSVYELPYYYVGKVIHIGFSSNAITQKFKYGHDSQLLSITKTNANYRVINRCTGIGSNENIPYYYPNNAPKGQVGVEADANNISIKQADITIVDKDRFSSKLKINEVIEYKKGDSTNAYQATMWMDEGTAIYPYELSKLAELPIARTINTAPVTRVWGGAIWIHLNVIKRGTYEFGIQPLMRRTAAHGGTHDWKPDSSNMTVTISKMDGSDARVLTEKEYARWALGDLPIDNYKIKIYYEWGSKDFGYTDAKVYAVIKAISWGYSGEFWYDTSDHIIDLANIGISITKTPAIGDKFKQIELKQNYIPYAQNLMPPIYRDSKGLEHFYNAKNNTYKIPGSNEYYVFENEYTEGNPKEIIVSFEGIKPSIENVKNAAGQLIGQIVDVAFDDEDNDELNKEQNAYVHPYFYVKLRKFDGSYGFNLWDQAITSGEMTISMTSGKCGACNFVIEAKEEGDNNKKTLFQNPVQVDERGNLVKGNYEQKINKENIQPEQQDTRNREIWIALKKDDSTFNVVMPNETNNYKPEAGDTFVIVNIDLPQAYVLAAENKLKEEIIKYMFQNNSEKFNFSITFSRIYLEEHPDVREQINENARLQIEYNDNTYELYVSNYTYKVSENEILPEITVELSDTITIRKGTLQQSISTVQQSLLNTIGSIDFLKMGLKYFIRKDVPDTANGNIIFEDGIVVRSKTNIALNEEVNSIIEEDSNAIYEEYEVAPEPLSADMSLGELINVNDDVDIPTNEKVTLVKEPGTGIWKQEKLSINENNVIYISTDKLIEKTRITELTLNNADHQAILKLYSDPNKAKNIIVYRGRDTAGKQFLVPLSLYSDFSTSLNGEGSIIDVSYISPQGGYSFTLKLKVTQDKTIASVPMIIEYGASIIVDSELSDTSKNPVENRIITKYINDLMNEVFQISMTSFTGGGTYEIGSSVIPQLSWIIKRKGEVVNPTNATVNGGKEGVAEDFKSYTAPANISDNKSYNVVVYYNAQSVTRSASYNFLSKKYYGVSANTSLTSAEILSLSGWGWASSRTMSESLFDCSGGKYPYYCIPSNLYPGLEVWVGQFRNTDIVVADVEVTNAQGYTTTYKTVRLNTIQFGKLYISFK